MSTELSSKSQEFEVPKMSARKARKLADGSRKDGTIQDESDISVDNEFSLVESRKHQSRSGVRQSLEMNSGQSGSESDDQLNEAECSQRAPRKRKRTGRQTNGDLTNGDLANDDLSDDDLPNRRSTRGRSNGNRGLPLTDEESDSEFSRNQLSQFQASQTQFSTQYSTQDGYTQADYSQATFDEASQNDESMTASDDAVTNTDDLQPDCGTIESVQLFNFMCHDHFEITFNPRVNFVIGKNGSK